MCFITHCVYTWFKAGYAQSSLQTSALWIRWHMHPHCRIRLFKQFGNKMMCFVLNCYVFVDYLTFHCWKLQIIYSGCHGYIFITLINVDSRETKSEFGTYWFWRNADKHDKMRFVVLFFALVLWMFYSVSLSQIIGLQRQMVRR